MPYIKKNNNYNKRYTSAEDRAIIKAIKANPGNIQKGLKEASTSLVNRTSSAINNRWYTKLSKSEKVFNLSSSTNNVGNNRKNVKNLNNNNVVYSLTEQLINKLSRSEKTTLLTSLINKL